MSNFISRSRILEHRAGLKSDLGVALELSVADGEGIIDDILNPGELATWVKGISADYLHFFDLNAAEPFNESNTEILNVRNVISNDGFRGESPGSILSFIETLLRRLTTTNTELLLRSHLEVGTQVKETKKIASVISHR